MNKRGQGLSTTAIILIILGLVVLAALIYYFLLGGKQLTPYLNTGNNVQTVVTQCSVACSTNSNYDFCNKQMTVNADGKSYTGTCENFATDKGVTTKNAADLKNVAGFKIASCPSITC